MLNEFAEETKQPLQNLFCWAHGDGGPSEEPVDDDGVLGYGLYFFAGDDGRRSRMIRFDEESQDFMELNKILKDLRCDMYCFLKFSIHLIHNIVLYLATTTSILLTNQRVCSIT